MTLPIDITVVGAGPAGLMAAEHLARAGCRVTVHDAMPSPARKFLMAGRGGLNLTHSEPLVNFLARYGETAPELAEAIGAFPPEALRAWADGLGAKTFTGSSGRVFPKAMKASPLLRAWLARLEGLGVRLHPRHRWRGWNAQGALVFDTPEGQHGVTPRATLLALGGASWPRLGSDGDWVETLRAVGIPIAPLVASNAGVRIVWSEHLRVRFAGEPLKRIALEVGGERRRGEAILTAQGLEGGALYALSAPLRGALSEGSARIHLDLRPDIGLEDLAGRLARPRGSQSLSTFLRKAAGLPSVAVALLREAGPPPMEAGALAARIKALPLTVEGMMPLERAISTAGGVRFDALDGNFMLTDMPGTFAAGEMLDWDAPTGGYLLQACFATAVAAARGILRWLEPGRA